ncbi:hypothetical protein KDK95_14680 [Actinospica sp. MGRD01-02]|uniref:Uncharacterized protein n=1 Tax=Actinospica acidithermotolerans TaxID=2828514 RepID=A0A941ILE6_9ACTN|nr:hypothetical protein [Actinospica acidithermotolerans]MBR7827561.1 hypothetical protein [Actinospica acidithermotolerans]
MTHGTPASVLARTAVQQGAVWRRAIAVGQDERVVENEADLLALLRELDDPEWLEWPRSYDRRAAADQLARVTARLEADFATSCATERDAQDSSEYGRILVPAEATRGTARIVVCVSKFGSLAVICAENPGAYFGTQDAFTEGALDPADLAKVEKALIKFGCTVVPEELLKCDYDGPSLPYLRGRPIWADRFFGVF